MISLNVVFLWLLSIVVLQRVLVTVVAEVVHHVLLELVLVVHGEHGLAHGAHLAAGVVGLRGDAHQDSVLLLRHQRPGAALEAGHAGAGGARLSQNLENLRIYIYTSFSVRALRAFKPS